MRNIKPLEVIEVKGTWREIGRQYGEAYPEKIKNNIELYLSALTRAYKADKKAILSTAQKFAKPLEEYTPEWMDEIKGIAEGANLSFEEVFLLTAARELTTYYPQLTGCTSGCTSFACTGEATKNGETITGQSLDWPPELEPAFLRVQPTEGPKSLLIGTAGCLLLDGINSAGLALQSNLLLSKPSGVGVPVVALYQKVLQQKNLADAISVLFNAPKPGSYNYLMASAEGDIVNVEITKDEIDCLFPESDIITHANAHLSPRFKHFDIIGGVYPDSYLRAERMKTLMRRHHGELSVDVIKQLVQDHNDYPDSICRHIDLTGPPEQYLLTRASIISVPAEGKMYVTNGCPCENAYVVYRL
jgi:isopenicillin-N N-acyltransferase-like protein